MSRYDELSPRALWFLENFDELTLAEMCAANEATSQAADTRTCRRCHCPAGAADCTHCNCCDVPAQPPTA